MDVRTTEINLRKSPLSSLQLQYQSVCEQQQRSTVRNKALLQDLQRLQHQMSISTVPTTQLKTLKHQYEEYVSALYPQWLTEVQAYRAQSEVQAYRAQSGSSSCPERKGTPPNAQPLGSHGYNLQPSDDVSREGSWLPLTTTSSQRTTNLVYTSEGERNTRMLSRREDSLPPSAANVHPGDAYQPALTYNQAQEHKMTSLSQVSKPATTKYLQPDRLIPNSAKGKPPISKSIPGLKPSRIPTRIQHKPPSAASRLQPPKYTATAKTVLPSTPHATETDVLTIKQTAEHSSIGEEQPEPVAEVRLLEEDNGEPLRPVSTEDLGLSSLSASSIPDEMEGLPIAAPSLAPIAPTTPSPSLNSSSLQEDDSLPSSGNDSLLPSGNDLLPPSGNDLLPPSWNDSLPSSGNDSLPSSGNDPLPSSGNDLLPSSGNDLLPPSGNDPLPSSGNDLLPPSGNDLLPPSGNDLLPPSGNDLLPPSGNDLLPPSGNDSLPPLGNDPLPPSGNDLLPPSGNEQQEKASSSKDQGNPPPLNKTTSSPEHSLEDSEVSSSEPHPSDGKVGANESAYQFLAQSMLPAEESEHSSLLSEGSAVAELEKELQAVTTREEEELRPLSTRSGSSTHKTPLVFPSPPDGGGESGDSSSSPFSPAYVPTAIEHRTSTELRKKLGFWGDSDSESEVELPGITPLNEDKEDFDFYG